MAEPALKDPLAIRISDRAIFEPSFPDFLEEDAPLTTTVDTRRFLLGLGTAPEYYFRRLVPVKRSWWFGYKLVRNGEIWQPVDESEFEVMEKKDVLCTLATMRA